MATHPASAIQQAGSVHRNAEKVQFLSLSRALVYKSVLKFEPADDILFIYCSWGETFFFFLADHSTDMLMDHEVASPANITTYNILAMSSVISSH